MKKIKENCKYVVRKVFRKGAPVVASLIPLSVLSFDARAQLTIVASGISELHFGQFTVDAGLGGTVTITPAGARTTGGGGVTLLPGAGLEAAGRISVTASTGLVIEISMQSPTFTIDDAGAGAPMNVNAFNIDGNGSNFSQTFTMTTMEFPIGATLNVAAGQGEGSYTGTYSVVVNYQ